MLKVVIIGYGTMFTNLIAGTLNSGSEIVGVLRKEMVKYNPFFRGIKDVINPSIEHNYIKSYNLHEISGIKSVNSPLFKRKLLKLNPDILLVGSWGEKIDKETFDIPRIATINAHPSLLPKYRGPNPYYWTILNGEKMSGVTFHLLDNGFDTGAILAQEEIKIYPSDTGKELKERTVLTARSVVCELLKDLNEDMIIPLQQNEDRASYYSVPDEFKINFRKSAGENFNLIKACYPWSKSYFYINSFTLTPNPYCVSVDDNSTKFMEAGTIVDLDINSKTISVLCADNKILKMMDISLYKECDKYFTKNFFRSDVHVGMVI